MFQHAFDGKNCTVNQTSSGGNCTSWGVPDYINGGRKTGSGMNQWVNGSKTVQQDTVNILSEGIPYLTGQYTYADGNIIPSANPCWVGGAVPCASPTPFPDTQYPTPLGWSTNAGGAYLVEPAICPPGNQTPQGNVSYGSSACKFAGTKGLGTGNVRLNTNVVSGSGATVTFLTYKKTTECTLGYGPTKLATLPNHVNESTAHTPVLAGGTPAPLYFHSISITGLTGSTQYFIDLTCTDSSGNVFKMPQAAPGYVSFGGSEINLNFTTTPGSSGTFYLPIYSPF